MQKTEAPRSLTCMHLTWQNLTIMRRTVPSIYCFKTEDVRVDHRLFQHSSQKSSTDTSHLTSSPTVVGADPSLRDETVIEVCSTEEHNSYPAPYLLAGSSVDSLEPDSEISFIALCKPTFIAEVLEREEDEEASQNCI
jgi:hypothetical protein